MSLLGQGFWKLEHEQEYKTDRQTQMKLLPQLHLSVATIITVRHSNTLYNKIWHRSLSLSKHNTVQVNVYASLELYVNVDVKQWEWNQFV